MFNRTEIESGKQIVTLEDLRDIVKTYEREQAPGSETSALTVFCDWRRKKNDTDIISPEDAIWWMDYYEAQGSLDDLSDEHRDEVLRLLESGEPAAALKYIDSIDDGAEEDV